ncbi:MAG: beta-1,6-N-acetylglucosaminyltransferase [Novosphingobium sp.]|nr:beta-1,6-N-acetylglucosaminyltransferase [Novosphingobium sp.]
MRMAYLILAHDDLAQLEMLVERLVPRDSPDVAIIHADRGSALWPGVRERWPEDGARVRIVRDPVAVRWGHWSQVAATERLVRAAHEADCDHAHFLSGADWPILSREAMARELAAQTLPACHIEALPGVQEDRMQCRRLDTRWLRLDRERDRIAYALTWELRRLSRWIDTGAALLGRERSRPYGQWRKGSCWWTLPREAIGLLARELPALIASGRLHGTLCCDEHVVPTIIAARFPDRIRPNRRYVDWSEGQSSPRVLDRSDAAEILASDAWFIRKVSARHDAFFRELRLEGAMAPAPPVC